MDFTQIFCIIVIMPKRPAKASKRISNKRKRGFSWKTLVKARKTQKKFKKGVALALLVTFSLVFLAGIWGYKAITKPFASAESSTSFDINNSDIVSVAIISVEDIDAVPAKTSSIHFVIFDKAGGKVVSYEIDLATTTDVPGKFGVEPYSNILSLGMLDSDELSSGSALLVATLEKDFAFNTDRYMVVDDAVTTAILDTFVQGEGNSLLSLDILQKLALSIDTNVTLSEFFNLFTFVRSLRKDRFIANLFENEENLDISLRDLTFDSNVAIEKASVGILNGTDMPGVANFASRVVRNAGGHVIAAENASKIYDESLLLVESTDLAVVKEIQKFFDVKNVVLKSRGGVNEGISDRVDVTLVIGVDIAGRL